MQNFERVFHEMDVNNHGYVTTEDLQNYAVHKNLVVEKFVNKWLGLFDTNNSGIIHLDEFRQALGLNPPPTTDEGLIEPTISSQPSFEPPPMEENGDAKIFTTDMSTSLQKVVLQLSEPIYKDHGDQPIFAATKVVEAMNAKHGMYWDCRLPPGDKPGSVNYVQGTMIHYTPNGKSRVLLYMDESRHGSPCCCCNFMV